VQVPGGIGRSFPGLVSSGSLSSAKTPPLGQTPWREKSVPLEDCFCFFVFRSFPLQFMDPFPLVRNYFPQL